MSGKLFLFATIRPRPEHFDKARDALDRMMAPTLEEPGCHVFAAFTERENGKVLHLFECFDNQAALDAHYGKEDVKTVFAAYADWLASPVEVTKLSAVSADAWQQFHD